MQMMMPTLAVKEATFPGRRLAQRNGQNWGDRKKNRLYLEEDNLVKQLGYDSKMQRRRVHESATDVRICPWLCRRFVLLLCTNGSVTASRGGFNPSHPVTQSQGRARGAEDWRGALSKLFTALTNMSIPMTYCNNLNVFDMYSLPYQNVHLRIYICLYVYVCMFMYFYLLVVGRALANPSTYAMFQVHHKATFLDHTHRKTWWHLPPCSMYF